MPMTPSTLDANQYSSGYCVYKFATVPRPAATRVQAEMQLLLMLYEAKRELPPFNWLVYGSRRVPYSRYSPVPLCEL